MRMRWALYRLFQIDHVQENHQSGQCHDSDGLRPNALRVSRRLEGTTLRIGKAFLPLLAAKIAPIQPVGCTRLLARNLFVG
jgi:hypothetical protein